MWLNTDLFGELVFHWNFCLMSRCVSWHFSEYLVALKGHLTTTYNET